MMICGSRRWTRISASCRWSLLFFSLKLNSSLHRTIIRRPTPATMLRYKTLCQERAKLRADFAARRVVGREYNERMNALAIEIEEAEPAMLAEPVEVQRLTVIEVVPASYRKISARFPHLGLDGIEAFEKAVSAAGGSVMVHSGLFKFNTRETIGGCGCGKERQAHFVGWTCCYILRTNGVSHSAAFGDPMYFAGHDAMPFDMSQKISVLSSYPKKQPRHWPDSPIGSILDPNPLGVCDLGMVFTLDDKKE